MPKMPDSVPLSKHTTFHVGGSAREFYEALSAHELCDLVREADDAGMPLLVLGGGSNLLVADEGFDGRVIKTMEQHIGVLGENEGRVQVEASAGVAWDKLVLWTVSHGYAGIASLSGIPGTVGASPVQNIGAYGHEVAETLVSIKAFDRVSQQEVVLTNEDLGFGYRTSLIKRSVKDASLRHGLTPGPTGRWVVLSATFELEKSANAEPTLYAELAKSLAVALGERAPLHEVRDHVMALRKSKGMYYDPTDHDCWSAGSFFTNPILSAEQEQALDPQAPRYPYRGQAKTSAAWLISQAGFPKGFALPNSQAALSGKHVLALTNRGAASAQEIEELASHIRKDVLQTYGISLEMEPVTVGFEPSHP